MSHTINQIKNIIHLYGLTQKELATKSGFSESQISRWFNNKRTPTINDIEKIVETLNCELEVIDSP